MSVFEGSIYLTPSRKVSKGGKDYIAFSIEQKKTKEIREVLLFGNEAELKEAIKDLELGVKVRIGGREGEAFKGEEDGTPKILASSYTLPGKHLTATEKTILESGGLEEWKKQNELFDQEMEAKGFVKVKMDSAETWRKKEFCIQRGNDWVDRMEYIMDRLNPEFVTMSIKSLGITHYLKDLVKNKMRYEAFIDECLREAVAGETLPVTYRGVSLCG